MKKISALICAAIFIISGYPAIYAADAEDEIVYVAFGDSIAEGYGLDGFDYELIGRGVNNPDKGYVFLTSQSVIGCKTVCNYAYSGMTSNGLLSRLNSLEGTALENTRQAGLITVSIGSNDILLKFTGIIRKAFESLGGSLDEAGMAKLTELLSEQSVLDELNNGVQTYQNNLPKIVAKLRELNPDAQIIFTEFYNPYYGVKFDMFDFSSLCDRYIQSMNKALHDYKELTGESDIAPVYLTMNVDGLTNTDRADGNYDPHPNKSGHKLIADAVISVLNIEKIKNAAALHAVIDTKNTDADATGDESRQTEYEPVIADAQTSESGLNSETNNGEFHSERNKTGIIIFIIAAGVTVFTSAAVIILAKKKK